MLDSPSNHSTEATALLTPIQYEPKPYLLRSNSIFFHDWRYVFEGNFNWKTTAEKEEGRYFKDLKEPAKWTAIDMPYGIRLRTVQSQNTEPFLDVGKPWEEHLRHPSVVLDSGIYRLWYGTRKNMCYAESDDAFTWRKPRLGIQEIEGSKHNNVVIGMKMPPQPDYFNLGNVFVDPSAPATERYKALYMRRIAPDVMKAFTAKYPGELSPHYQDGADEDIEKEVLAVGGAVSADGLRWKPTKLPLTVHRADTQNMMYFDEVRNTYVGYFRTHVFRRRSIGRAESKDFRHFPLLDTIIWPDASVGPSDVWYSIGRVSYPGAPDYHLMFAGAWHVTEDNWYHRLATSPDGVMWGWVPGERPITLGDGRAWDAGCISMGAGMVALPGDRVGIPYTGYHIPHKYPRSPGLGKFAWATWQKGRVVALEAEERGEFITKRVRFEGNTLRVNVNTKHVGSLAVEVVGEGGKPIEGRSFADCDVISGDHLDKVVT